MFIFDNKEIPLTEIKKYAKRDSPNPTKKRERSLPHDYLAEAVYIYERALQLNLGFDYIGAHVMSGAWYPIPEWSMTLELRIGDLTGEFYISLRTLLRSDSDDRDEEIDYEFMRGFTEVYNDCLTFKLKSITRPTKQETK